MFFAMQLFELLKSMIGQSLDFPKKHVFLWFKTVTLAIELTKFRKKLGNKLLLAKSEKMVS